MIDSKEKVQYFIDLQTKIVAHLEYIDGNKFITDSWTRPEGGGGTSRLIENGRIFERAGCNFSHVLGTKLPPAATEHRPELIGQSWEAMGVSLVLHPRNPHCPTVHLNVRTFVTESGVTWYGGGMDLTPYYYYQEDELHWHKICRQALDPYGADLYDNYSAWCDRYFYLKHRKETRGLGGIFYDDVSTDQAFDMTQSVGDHFLPAYCPILLTRNEQPWTEEQRNWQLYRRGRYVEYNLVFDRGTLFGLQSNGRTESILMSMPPLARWTYNYEPEVDSPEHKLMQRITR